MIKLELKKHKPVFLVIVICILILFIWFFLLIPEFEKLPLDYSFYMD